MKIISISSVAILFFAFAFIALHADRNSRIPCFLVRTRQTHLQKVKKLNIIDAKFATDSKSSITDKSEEGHSPTIEILEKGNLYAVVNKPGSIKCHRSEWTGKTNEVPMLQQIRDTIHRRVVRLLFLF